MFASGGSSSSTASKSARQPSFEEQSTDEFKRFFRTDLWGPRAHSPPQPRNMSELLEAAAELTSKGHRNLGSPSARPQVTRMNGCACGHRHRRKMSCSVILKRLKSTDKRKEALVPPDIQNFVVQNQVTTLAELRTLLGRQA
mmetsp:Transcript_5697/g.10206  ORF Transcript_5697/g.10206 Transcript_5697/m.10206 type:complete len:142 (-) Transcript_5697:9-434(-)